MRKRLTGIVFALTVALLLAACGGGGSGGTSGAAGDPLVIGVHIPETGPASFVGQGFRVGVDLAVKEINANGGINGRELEAKFVDDKGTTDGALTAVRQLITRDRVLAVMSGSTSTATLGVVPYFRQNPTLYYVSLASDPRVLEQFNENIFVGAAISQADAVKIYADHLQNDLQAKRVAMMLCDQGHCIAGGPLLEQELASRGIDVVTTTTFNSGDTDFTGQVQKIKQSQPDAVFIFALPADGGRILPQLRRAGVDVPLAGDISTAHEIVPQVAGPAAEGFTAFFQAGTQLLSDTSGPMAKWQASLKKYVKDLPEGTPNSYSLQAYSDTYALAEGIRAAGDDPTSKKIIDSLEQLDGFVPGEDENWKFAAPISFPRTFTEKDHQGNRQAIVVTVKNGEFVKAEG